jgi:hypothetical protein
MKLNASGSCEHQPISNIEPGERKTAFLRYHPVYRRSKVHAFPPGKKLVDASHL